MHLKIKKSRWFVILIILLLLSLTTTITKKQFSIIKHDSMQKLMTLDLGFSDLRNLLDTGEDKNYAVIEKIASLIYSLPKIVDYKFFSKTSHNFDRINININFSDYLLIKKDRERAIKDMLLSSPTKVKAKIQYKDKEYKVKLRLKGDLAGHWTSKYRYSLRVDVKDNKTIFGFSSFSIHKPRERQHPYDYTFQSIIRDTGNLASTHKFAHIFVNGDDWGIMDIEEHMSKELLEKQNRKDSVIVRFANEEKWLDHNNKYSPYRLSDPLLYTHLYNKKSLKDTHNRKIYSYIANNRLLNNKEIFDIDSFSKAFIVSLAWNNRHTLANANSRYYFNPYSLKLEPITTDQGYWTSIYDEIAINNQYVDILSNEYYFNNLDSNLQKASNSVFNVNKHLSYPQSLFPVDKKKDGSIVIENMKEILNNKEKYLIEPMKKGLSFHENINIDEDNASDKKIDFNLAALPTKQQASKFKKHLHIRHYTNGNLELYNLLPDTITVKDIIFNGKSFINDKINIPSYLSNPEPTVINTPYLGIQDNMFTVNTVYQGFNNTIKNSITLISDVIKNPLLLDTTHEFHFINKLDDKTYEIKQGNWTVNKPIIVDGNLYILPGTNIQFSKNAYIIVKGSLTAIGSEENPIILDAVSDSWKGIFVLNANNKSYLKNVNISNISALEDGLLKLTGGITFYKSDIDFENVIVNYVKAEDAINIVESSFYLNKVIIDNTVSDGLDSDFSTGDVLYSDFSNIGGDALDFSGSSASIRKIKVNNIKDKAISAGEKSTLNIENSSFNNTGVGIASKDGSSVVVSNTKISDYKLYAAMSYIKKDFYGSPSIILNDCLVSNGNAYIRQKGTNMVVDSIKIKESNLSVKKLYKTRVMAK